MSISPALSLDRLVVSLNGQPVLDDISLSVARGERVALLGESGSGKSMTARAALGLLPAHAAVSGRVAVNGCDVTLAPALSRPAAARPAMIMQDTLAALNPLATIGHQIEQPLRRAGLGRRAAREAACELLASVGLPDSRTIARRTSPELSGGQRQRVCIAIALACRAPVLVADEPTSALDVVTQAQILRLLHEVTARPDGPGLVFITHDLHAAAHLCERALVIASGRIVEEAPMERLLNAPVHGYTRRLIASAARCGIACERLYG